MSNRYVAPEIWAGVGATAKADVYSFGILMIEIVTGHRPNWPVKPNIQDKAEVDLVDWAREKIEAGQASEVLDCRIGIEEQAAGGTEADKMKGLLDFAWRCTAASPKDRPSMEEVVAMLNKL
jgi:serine/threonine protein kinase